MRMPFFFASTSAKEPLLTTCLTGWTRSKTSRYRALFTLSVAKVIWMSKCPLTRSSTLLQHTTLSTCRHPQRTVLVWKKVLRRSSRILPKPTWSTWLFPRRITARNWRWSQCPWKSRVNAEGNDDLWSLLPMISALAMRQENLRIWTL